MKEAQLNQLILQSLEHEMGGVKVYEMAVSCAVNEDLREEWSKYLEQTRSHVQILLEVCNVFELDPDTKTTGREVVKAVGGGLLKAMQIAKAGGDENAAELVACECVVLAEIKDHQDWELMGKCAEKLTGTKRTALTQACEQVEDQEDEHLYHTKGWCRELWIKSLGMKAVLPPPEEEHHVKTAIGAARAEQASLKSR